MTSNTLRKVQRTKKLGIDRLITHLDKHGREINDQDTIIERIDELYTELYDSEHSTIIHTDPKYVSEIASWEVELPLLDMKNETATGNDYIKIEKLKAREDIIHLENTC